MHRGAFALFTTGVVAVILLPIAAIAFFSIWDSANTLNKAAAVWVHPLPPDDKVRTSVDLVLTWTVVPPVLAPAWTGLVTAVQQIPPGGLSSGDAIATIDGVTRLAVHTDSPFHRSLSLDDSGPDVAMLNVFLAQRGLEARDDDYFGSATLRGVRAFAESIGVPSVSDVGSFDPTWLVYLPAGSEGVANSVLTLQVGAPAPSAGSKLVAPTLRLAAGELTAPGAVIPDAAGPAPEVDLTRPVIPTIPDAQKVLLPAGATLQFAALDLSVDGSSLLSPQGISSLASAVSPGEKSVKAVMVASPHAGSVLIPSAAIFAASNLKLCVVRRRAGESLPIAVEVLSNAAGRSVVTGDVTVTDEVLISPNADQRKCG